MQMLEPFFGSGGAMWMGAPPQATMMMPPFTVPAQPLTPSTVSALPPMANPTAFQASGFPPTAFGQLTSVPPYSYQATLTAPGLLAAVALRRGQPQGPAND